MAQTSAAVHDGSDWKAKLRIPAKDTRVQTAVRTLYPSEEVKWSVLNSEFIQLFPEAAVPR